MNGRRAAARGSGLRLRPPLPADLPEIAALVAGLIPRHIGGSLTADGVRHLLDYMRPGAIGARLAGRTHPGRSPALVACLGAGLGGRVVAYGAVRNDTHISQVYVAEDWHRRGAGALIMRGLVEEIRRRHPMARAVTLNAVPRAIDFYLRQGFAVTGPGRAWPEGVVSHPMALRLGSA